MHAVNVNIATFYWSTATEIVDASTRICDAHRMLGIKFDYGYTMYCEVRLESNNMN
jgi:hypothetical protein